MPTTSLNANRDTLDAIMEFGHIITVTEPNIVTEYSGTDYLGESIDDYLDDNGQSHDELSPLPTGWELLTNRSGQYSYHGPVFHPSEYIGGRLADAILSTPGNYVALIVTGIHADDCDCGADQYHGEDANDSDDYGWAIAFKPLD